MKLSKKFQEALTRYLEWYKCTTPMSSFPHGERNIKTSQDVMLGTFLSGIIAGTSKDRVLPHGEKISPEEIIFERETHGKVSATDCSDFSLLSQYDRGKANRDWWYKEIGWWTKHAEFVPEEFLIHLTPECFIEVFGRPPRVHPVRYCYDNFYSEEEWKRDAKRCLNGYETIPSGVVFIR